jgi:hypothetical protein
LARDLAPAKRASARFRHDSAIPVLQGSWKGAYGYCIDMPTADGVIASTSYRFDESTHLPHGFLRGREMSTSEIDTGVPENIPLVLRRNDITSSRAGTPGFAGDVCASRWL